jgi:hypothetical protein
MRKSCLAALALVVAALPAASQPKSTLGHEAEWALTFYGKYAFLIGVNEPVQAAQLALRGHKVDEAELAKKTEDGQAEITLSDMKVGPMEEIREQKWFEMATFPAAPREALHVQVSTGTYNDIDAGNKVAWQTATAAWVTAQDPPPDDMIGQWNMGYARR